MKDVILSLLKSLTPVGTPIEVSVSEQENFGHYSTNVAMRLASTRGGSASDGKAENKTPMAIAQEFTAKIVAAAPIGFYEKVEAVAPGFINFWLSPKTIQSTFSEIADKKEYGRSDDGKKKTVIIEYSSPNIAKILNVGHLRNTIIGEALANIFEYSGYAVVRWNYLGDWGTQFGKLIAAYKMWGKKEDIEKNPIEELQKLYVRFHEEAKTDSEIEKKGQEEFKELENGDKENRKLWEWFRKESIEELKRSYKVLGADFDVWIGESFFESEMKSVVRELREKGIAEESEGAIVIRLDAFHLPPALVEKSDGASLYLTRDIANLRYRLKKYKPAKILYVIGNEQSFQFEQLFAVAKVLGMDSALLTHVKYGLVLGESGKKLSTREGRTVSMSEIIEKSIALAKNTVREKNPELREDEKNEIALAVGIGAVKYNDLKENRMTDIVFDWEKMLSFTGDSGPYLQYTYARLKSILRKSKVENRKSKKVNFGELGGESEMALMRKLFEFPDAIQKSRELLMTSILANYLYKLASIANKFYETTPILNDENESRRAARLVLIDTASRVLKTGLSLLGIQTPEKI